jgi:type IV secretory pathway TrbD component
MLSLLGSKRAARRVAARRRERGRDEGLKDAVIEVENGRAAGSGQVRDWEAKLLGVGIWNVGLSAACVLRWSALIGRSALARNSFTDLVWW